MSIDKLFFYSKSRDAAPGKGANEHVSNPEEYQTLDNIPHWRKVLSNFHYCPFKYNGYTYNTIEHVFQAEKIRLANPEKSYWFTVESGHEIGQGDGALAQKNRKLVRLTSEQLAEWNQIKHDIMESAAIEKYKTCSHARKVLRATRDAELWHVVSRQKPTRFTHLERIRESLRIRRD